MPKSSRLNEKIIKNAHGMQKNRKNQISKANSKRLKSHST